MRKSWIVLAMIAMALAGSISRADDKIHWTYYYKPQAPAVRTAEYIEVTDQALPAPEQPSCCRSHTQCHPAFAPLCEKSACCTPHHGGGLWGWLTHRNPRWCKCGHGCLPDMPIYAYFQDQCAGCDGCQTNECHGCETKQQGCCHSR